MLSDRVKDRLLNWKFEQARTCMLAEINDVDRLTPLPTESEQETVHALADTFGNPGWFEGSMADIVRAAVWYLGVVDD